MSKLFISYRRSDAEDATGRIYDRLVSRYRRKNVFKDVDSIPRGVDFRDHVKSSILESRVTLVIIGRGWLNAQSEQGQRRLNDPEDFVRIEIETALATPGMVVIPVLVGRAAVPPAPDLPPSLQKLIYLNASLVRPDPDFNDDLQELISELDPYMRFQWNRVWQSLPKLPKQFSLTITVGISFLLAIFIFVGPYFLTRKVGSSVQPSGGSATHTEEEPKPAVVLPTSNLRDSIPYNPKFIGRRTIALPEVTDQMSAGDRLDGRVFDYVHYSLMMDERRAMPLYTAYNIDRTTMKRVPRQADRWLLDPRIPTSLQTDTQLYEQNEWDRGHMVPRRAVMWGDSLVAARAALSTFYYSNTVPQHQTFNQRNWAALENYVLHRLRPEASRLSVFAGPVNRQTDFEYRGRRVPRSFWMIAAVSDESNPRHFFVYAYLMDQYIVKADGGILPVAPIRNFDPRMYEVKVSQIEAVTPLLFGNLR